MRFLFLLILILLLGGITEVVSSQNVDNLLQNFKQETDKDTASINTLNQIASLLKNSNPKNSLHWAREAGRLSDSLNYSKGKAESLLLIADYYNVSSLLDSVLVFAQKGLDIYTEIEDKKGMASCLSQIGKIHYYLGDITNALDFKHRALDIYVELADSSGLGYSYASLGTNYLDIGDYETAIKYANNAVEIAIAIKNEEAESYALNNLGVIYENQGDFARALECYQESFLLDESHENYIDASVSASNVATIFKEQDDFESAIKFCKKGIAYAKKVGYKTGLTYSYEYLGQIYKAMGDYEKAWPVHVQNMRTHEEIGNKQGVAMAYRDMADLYVLLEKLDSALIYYNKSVDLSKAVEYKQIEADSYVGIARVNYKNKQYEKAYNYSIKACTIAKNISSIRTMKNCASILALSCESLGLYKEAYEAQVLFKAMSDSLFNKLNIKRIAHLKYQYKYEKDKELIELAQERKDKLAAFQLKKQTFTRNFLVVGLIILLSLVFIILRGLMQKKAANKLLQHKNSEIENQAEKLRVSNESLVQLSQFKEDMTNMVIHDLKNPLSAIINNDLIKDDERRKAIIKHSGYKMMNLVENILEVYKYESTNFDLRKESVKLKGLVESSIEEVEFLAENKHVQFNINVDDTLVIYADSRVLRRIIVNVLSNAVKYATKESTVKISAIVLVKEGLRIEIHNEGSYIEPKNQALVFDKFGQINSKEQGRVASTGLGLAFCKIAIDAHKGRIGVESDKIKGTTFWFVLPEINAQELSSFEGTRHKKLAVQLSYEQKSGLRPIYKDLMDGSVYDIATFDDVFATIENEKLGNDEWVEALKNSAYNFNDAAYRALVNLIVE